MIHPSRRFLSGVFLTLSAVVSVSVPALADSSQGQALSRQDMLDQFHQELVKSLGNAPHGQEIIDQVEKKFQDSVNKQFPPANNPTFDPKAVEKSSQGVAKLVEAALKQVEASGMNPGADRDNAIRQARNLADEGNKKLNESATANDKSGGSANQYQMKLMAAKMGQIVSNELPPIAMSAARDVLSRYQNSAPTPVNGPGTSPSYGDITQAKPDPNDAGSMVASAEDKIFKGDMPGALADANKAVDLGGGADALAVRGGIELDQHQYSKANQDAQQALQLDPNNRDAAAIAHFTDGRTDGIATGGPAGAKVEGTGAEAGGGGAAGGMGGGFAGGTQGGVALAGGIAALSGSLRSSSGAGAGAALSGMTGEQARKSAQDALGMGDLGGAMAFVNQALKQNPRDPELLNLRSSIYARQRDYARAIDDAKAGLEISPKDPALLRSLGFAQLREKDYEGAMATANEMLELNPNDPYAYAIRAHAYGSMGDKDAMMADLKRAAELDPEFAAAAAQWGGQLQLPQDKDILFLFPGEESASTAAKTPAPASGRGRNFGLLVGASALGGLLLAFGLLQTVMAPLKEKVTSAFTRITRTGPTVAPIEEDTARPASVNGLMPGLIRGQYELSRQIGAGGMGLVYAGTDRSLGRPVAIKKMRDELRFDPREKARFVAEAKTVAALHHPNIVDIYAIAEEGDDVFLVFEYVDGKTVHELLQAGGKLAPERAATIVRASSDALEYAHSRGVIHRDMKPSNVMLDQAGRVKVMDFGIARMAKDTMLRQSMTNTVVGTPPYMAPEQEQGRVRKESDVYSLAICAYEMLTGKLPFAGIGAGMLMNKINMSYVPPSRENAGLPPALDPVFDRAFQADPEKRWRAPAEFAAALEAALTEVRVV